MATIYEISTEFTPKNWTVDSETAEKALAECAASKRKPSNAMAHSWNAMNAVRAEMAKDGHVFAQKMGVWVRVKPSAASKVVDKTTVTVKAKTVSNLATPNQIGYLKSLMDNDPAAAMGLNLDDKKISTLTKSEASRLINQMQCY